MFNTKHLNQGIMKYWVVSRWFFD